MIPDFFHGVVVFFVFLFGAAIFDRTMSPLTEFGLDEQKNSLLQNLQFGAQEI